MQTAQPDDLMRTTRLERDGTWPAMSSDDKRRILTLLVARHGNDVYRCALAWTGDRHVAEDVRQQVFVEAYRDLDRFAGRSSLRSWLLGITRHRCLDATKLGRRWNHRFKNECPAEPEIDDRSPDRELDRRRLARTVASCLAKLAPEARQAVVLRYHQDLSYHEAAAVVGDRAGTLQRRVARALRALRRDVEAVLGPVPVG